MRTPPCRQLFIPLYLLHQLCTLTSSLGDLGPAMKMSLCFALFGMFQQSKLAPRSLAAFDISHHTCRGDVISATAMLIVVHWTKTVHVIDNNHVLPIPKICDQKADPLEVYSQLL